MIEGRTTIGKGNRIWQFNSIGSAPQDKKYRGEPTRLEIGEGCVYSPGDAKLRNVCVHAGPDVDDDHGAQDHRHSEELFRLLRFKAKITQTRIATAVSEIARNAFMYGGGGKVRVNSSGVVMPASFSTGSSWRAPGAMRMDCCGKVHGGPERE